ncbi:Cof-type HAD-IIB family hydrolase [Microbacterium barkeri]
MDGTLLDAAGEVPEAFWPLLGLMRERGIVFAPASGRQYATLARLFARASDGMPFIAENGAYVVRDGVEISSLVLDRAFVVEAVRLLRSLAPAGRDIGVVLCGKRSAYIERVNAPFVAEASRYYAALERVDDILAADDDVLKIAVYDFVDAATGTGAELDRLRETHQVVVSGRHWIDVMPPAANKGAAVESLQRELGVTRDETVAFGDYLNDLEMLDASGQSYAMANAHPDILARARFTAPASDEEGVVAVLRGLLDAEPAQQG